MPVRITFEQPLSDEALMRFSAANEWLRVERDPNGELMVMSPVGSEGSAKELDVAVELALWARRDGRGRAFGSTAGFTMPDTSVRAVDAAWVSLYRWNALTRKQQQGYAPICPEFVIEVRSKTDRLKTLQARMTMWIENGAEVAWLIDPQRKAVEIYRPGNLPEVLHEPSSVQGSGPVAGVEIWEPDAVVSHTFIEKADSLVSTRTFVARAQVLRGRVVKRVLAARTEPG